MTEPNDHPRFETPIYQCPICATALCLNPNNRQFACEHHHHFDLAKAGYLNLLPVQHKNSLEPGDNKPMLAARRAFLEAGYYAQMAQALAEKLTAHLPLTPLRLLDLGCGEGYYSRTIAKALQAKRLLQIQGVDIAKLAVEAAAKKQPEAHFVVASANRLPFADQYFDALFRVFAPSNAAELLRVIKPNGLLLTVTPGPRHLWQLKAFIYPEVREHPLEPIPIEGFKCLAPERLQYLINPNPAHRMALLQMTPFAWHANADLHQAIKAPEALDIEVDFCLTLYQKI